jgi:acetyltransferase-like isoleucine patch superfamily enzyme
MLNMDENKKINKKHKRSKIRYFILLLIVFLIFSLGFFPIVFYGKLTLYFLTFNNIFHWLLLPFLIYIGFVILIISELLFSGVIIHIFKIQYEQGEYDYSYENNNSFKWIIICSLYTPCRKIIEIFPVGKIKNVYYTLLGMKIGKNSLVGGIIKDPCVTEFGEDVTMGEYSIIYGHIHDYGNAKIMIKNVKIGNNCIIGAGSIIMPGAIIQDNVTIAAGAVVLQDQVLEKGKTYAGVPAKEIKISKKLDNN